MPGIFISYRREDAAPWAGRVYERLAQDFDRKHIFMDVDNIAPGLDFVEELERQVGECDTLLAIMGKNWVDARNPKGERRLDDPLDFVRIELEAALQRGVRVIPVLVDGTTMPAASELPESLQRLARRNAVELSHARFGSDVQRLVSAVASVVQPANSPRPSTTSTIPGARSIDVHVHAASAANQQDASATRTPVGPPRSLQLSAVLATALMVIMWGVAVSSPPGSEGMPVTLAVLLTVASFVLWVAWSLLYIRSTRRNVDSSDA